jgi:hypothetical protein
MTRTVLGFRLSTKHAAPPIRAKRKVEKSSAKAAAKRRGGRSVWPFRQMEIGESFFVSGVRRNNISAAAARYTDRSFACQAKIERGAEGVRVWRVQ